VKRLLLMLCSAAALAAPLAIAPTALAGTYHMAMDTSKSTTGWTLTHDNGFWGCSFSSRPGPCADADVPVPTSLRLFARGDVKAGDLAFWSWETPPTTSIAAGSVTVNYATTADTRVFMKARLRNFAYASQPQLHTAADDGTATWRIPVGYTNVGLFLASLANHSFTNKWSNTLRVVSIDAMLRDDTAPVATVTGPLASGQWLNQAQAVCATVSASDAGSGVASSQLRDNLASVLDSHALPIAAVAQPGDPSYMHDLCLTPSHLSDGSHDLVVRVADVAGEAVEVPFTARVDSHAPTAMATSPADTAQRRPGVSFSVDPGPSGLSDFQAWVDGQPMTVSGADAFYQPQADLTFGAHTVIWSATDQAGNHRDGFWTFRVVDDLPPVLTGAAPLAGSGSELRRPPLAFTLADDGSGIDPATLHVLLDGSDVAPFGTLIDGHFGYVPAADLAYGHHTVSVSVSDRYGNAMAPQQWGFDVIDATPPVLGDVRPDDGSAGADRTPAISFAVSDSGTGLDPAAISLTVDGRDVTARGVLAGGRFAYVPSDPLGYGSHSVSARAADRSGNVSVPLTWSFQVRDETPPVIAQRSPLPGSTVVGATPIGFSVGDEGTGVDDDTLQVTVDGSDVTAWGSFASGRFVYAPGNLGAGVHTVAVTVADTSGNVAGPVMWQFAVADPARVALSTLSVPSRITAGGTARLRYRATANNSPLVGTSLRLESRRAGQDGFSDAGVRVTDAGGDASWTVRPRVTTEYRVVVVETGAETDARTVVVAQRVTLAAARSRVHRGGTIHLSGSVRPGHAGAAVRVQLLTRRGWVTVSKPHLSARSRFAATLLPRVKGRYVFRVVAAATTGNATGTSRSVTVRVG
jgi:hypothetical protein